MKDTLKEVRANNLKQWFSGKTVPPKEKSYISQLMNGRSAFGEKSARRLEKDYGMPDYYLDQINHTKQEHQSTYKIEILDVTASAGNGYLNSDVQEVIRLIEYNCDQARLLFNGLMSSDLKVINIKGDSMQGTFESGDALYVDISIRSFDGDGIYVFTFAQNLYVKRLQIVKNVIRVKSDNKLYDTWEIHEKEIEQLYIHGKVMLSQSMLLRKHG